MRIPYVMSFVAISFCLGLFGCTTTTKPPALTATEEAKLPENKPLEHPQTLALLQKWDINAQVAVRNTAENKSETVNLVWQQNQANYHLSMFGPMGSHAVKLSGNSQGVVLEKSTGEKIKAKTPETLLAEQTGYELPVSNLYYWVRGLPVPDLPHETHLGQNRQLAELIQAGWRIEYLAYTSVNQMALPAKIFLYHPPFSVKIIISEWKI